MPHGEAPLDKVAVVVLGSGNAACSAALSAAETLSSASSSHSGGGGGGGVLMLEKAPEEQKGGNTFYTAGAYRCAIPSPALDSLLSIPVHNVAESVQPESDREPLVVGRDSIDVPEYGAGDFRADMERVTKGECDEGLTTALVEGSWDAVRWLSQRHGVRFRLSYERQAYSVEGKFRFWGGLFLSTQGGGKGLVEQQHASVRRNGIRVLYNVHVTGLVTRFDGTAVEGVDVCLADGRRGWIEATGGVVLACGGFESDRDKRARHLGPSWLAAHVRGTPHNTGDFLSLVEPVRAKLSGEASFGGCHATCWDALTDADIGDANLTNQFTKSGYPLGIIVNRQGRRFVDEGEDMRNYTYAKIGKAILDQPRSIGIQIYDSKTIPLLRREEYASGIVKRPIEADTLEELAKRLKLQDAEAEAAFLEEIHNFNAAVRSFERDNGDRKFDPSVRDGRGTAELPIPKSNWAQQINKGPFLAVETTCGITFTFGGLSIDPMTASVLSAKDEGASIEGLYAAGECTGGLFYHNYPGGSGLTSGTVFGRKAGRSAALAALEKQ